MSLVDIPDDVLFHNILELDVKDLVSVSSITKNNYFQHCDYLTLNSELVSTYIKNFYKNASCTGQSTSEFSRFTASRYNTPYNLSIDLAKIHVEAIKIILQKFPNYQQVTVIRPEKLPAASRIHEVAVLGSILFHLPALFSIIGLEGLHLLTGNVFFSTVRERCRDTVAFSNMAWAAAFLKDPNLKKVISYVPNIQKLHIHVLLEEGTKDGYYLMDIPSLPSLKTLEVSYQKESGRPQNSALFTNILCLKKYPLLRSLTLTNYSHSDHEVLSRKPLGHFLPPKLETLAILGSTLLRHEDISSILTTCTNLHTLKLQNFPYNIFTGILIPTTTHTSLKVLELIDRFSTIQYHHALYTLFPNLSELRIFLASEENPRHFTPSAILEHLVLTLKEDNTLDHTNLFADVSEKYPKLARITLIFPTAPTEPLPQQTGCTIKEVGKYKYLLEKTHV